MSSAGASFRALFGRIGIALVVCVALVAAGVVWVNDFIDKKVDSIPRIQLATSTSTNNGTNYLIIGSDSRKFVDNSIDQSAFGSETDNGPPRSDTLMVLHANGDKSFAVSFPRDTWVTIPGRGDMKINAAFNDGPQAVVDTLQQNFGLEINHYLEVDFVTFEGLVDAVGGVPVYFAEPTRDDFTGLGLPYFLGVAYGCEILDGGQALAYVRSRHPMEYINGTWKDASGLADLDRITRQQEFVKTLGRVAMDAAINDPTIAPDLADAVLPNLKADSGFNRDAFNELTRALLGLRRGDAGLEFATLPTDQARRDSQDVLLVDKASADPVLARLRGDVVVEPPATTAATAAGVTPSGPTPSNVRVSVRNASGASGAAGNALNALANEGFVAGTASNDARGTVARTEIRYRGIDAAKAQLVASYVAGADLVLDDSVGGDVVVVVGKNFTRIAKVAASGDTAATTVPPAAPSPQQACTG
ncbi:MAG: LCP family protein [Acidimicrobiia bacterium]